MPSLTKDACVSFYSRIESMRSENILLPLNDSIPHVYSQVSLPLSIRRPPFVPHCMNSSKRRRNIYGGKKINVQIVFIKSGNRCFCLLQCWNVLTRHGYAVFLIPQIFIDRWLSLVILLLYSGKRKWGRKAYSEWAHAATPLFYIEIASLVTLSTKTNQKIFVTPEMRTTQKWTVQSTLHTTFSATATATPNEINEPTSILILRCGHSAAASTEHTNTYVHALHPYSYRIFVADLLSEWALAVW